MEKKTIGLVDYDTFLYPDYDKLFIILKCFEMTRPHGLISVEAIMFSKLHSS